MGDNSGDTSRKIIVAIKNGKEISIAQLASQLVINTTAVENQLAKLKKKGILLRHVPKVATGKSVRKVKSKRSIFSLDFQIHPASNTFINFQIQLLN